MQTCRITVADKATSLVLASGSPRRSQMLREMGCDFTVQSADIDESKKVSESVNDYVLRLAQAKALAVKSLLSDLPSSTAILAADTIVAQGETVFGKPRDRGHAFEIWQQLSDRQHCVITAVCLHAFDQSELCLVSSDVEFCPIRQQQMQCYWDTGEPQDKAGAYAIQGLASAWVQLIHGSYSNIVGLPLRETNQLLARVQLNWL